VEEDVLKRTLVGKWRNRNDKMLNTFHLGDINRYQGKPLSSFHIGNMFDKNLLPAVLSVKHEVCVYVMRERGGEK
jgi:hypothetical protein